MPELTPEETAAMWLYGAEYARSGLSAVDWWARLDSSRRRTVQDFVVAMRRALDTPTPGGTDGR